MATVRIQLRRGTSSQWDTANPTLAAGEIGIETDTNTFKFGDGVTAWNSLSYALSDTVDDYIPLSEKGVALGVATLDASGYIPTSQLPPLAKITVNAVADQAARLALTVEPGDIAIQSDTGTTYVLQSSPASNNANWKEISATAAISAAVSAHESDTTNVHGISDTSILVTTTGTQTLTNKTITSPTGLVKSDVGLGNLDNTSDLNKPISTATQSALDLKAPLNSPSLTGVPTAPTAANGNSSTQIATTEFVGSAISNVIGAAPEALNTLNELAAAINDDENFAATVTTAFTNLGTTKLNASVFDTHNEATSNVHGITNALNLVYTDDSRLSDNRTPVDGSVTGTKIASGEITATHIADSSIITAKINDDAVVTAKLADSSVTTAKVVDSNITTAKLADDAVVAAKLADSSVTTAKVVDSNITTAKLADDAVVAAKIADNSVTTTKVADSNITTAKLADSSVTTAKVVDSNITTAKLADDAVVAAKIADNAVTESKIISDAVTSSKIADLNVTTAKVNDLAITTGKIAALAVTEDKIADSSITSAKIVDGSIVDADINASAGIAQSKISGLTSDLALKAPLAGPTFTGTVTLPSTTSVGTISSTELGYLDGVTSAIQTQIDAKLASATAASTYAPIASPTFTGTVSGITKTMVGLGNVDNTSDANKPVSTATQTALDLKADLASPTFTGTVVLPNTTSVGTVSSTEIGYLDGVTSAIQTQINAKADSSTVTSHTSATTSVHGISDTSQLAYKNAANQTFTGNLEVDGNMTVDGNLTVNGTTFNASATSITIEDNMVQLAHQNSANTVDLGLVVAYNDGAAKHAGIVRDVSANKWKLFKGVTTEPSTTVDFTQGSLDDIEVAGLVASSASIGDVSNTELQYLNGVTSAIQTQIDSKLASATAASTYAPIASPTFTGTVSGITKTMVGLGNVDNTSDANKPVSTATQTALNLKANLASPTFTGTVTVAASGVAFTDGTQTKAGVPSLTTIGTAIGAAYNLSTGGLTLRDQLIPISGAYAVTVPANSTTAYPVGTSISFYQSSGTGANFVEGSGVTILRTPGLKLRTTYSSATLTKVATDTWLLAGDLSA